jgi:hypothetical protein
MVIKQYCSNRSQRIFDQQKNEFDSYGYRTPGCNSGEIDGIDERIGCAENYYKSNLYYQMMMGHWEQPMVRYPEIIEKLKEQCFVDLGYY